MKRVPLSIRIAATLAVASLAACGGGGDAPASSTGTPAAPTAATPDSTSTSTSTAAAAPAPGTAPAPAAPPSSSPAAPAPAAPALVGDPVAGKALFSAIPGSADACIDCHTAVEDVRARAKTEAGYKAMIEYAIYQNVAAMAVLKFKLTDGQLQDIAAYLKSGNP